MYPYNIQKPKADPQKPLVMAQSNTTLQELIIEAITDETHDALFYENLSELITDPRDRNLVWDIHLDEVRHRGHFSDLYNMLAGEDPPEIPEPEDAPTGVLGDDFISAIMDETEAMEFYNQIRMALTDPAARDILMQIVIDESRHADLFSYLYAKYK